MQTGTALVSSAGTLLDTLKNWALTTGYKLVVAIILLVIGFKIVNSLSKKLGTFLSGKVKMDRTVLNTLVYASSILAKGIILVFLISYLGIEMAGISALLASAGIGIGMAVNGTLSNLSGGVMLLITRPFGIGDYIKAQGQEGTVQDIHISYTHILTNDKKNVYLPNSILSAGTIVNCTSAPTRRLEFDFSIGDNDPEAVRKILLRVMHSNRLILKNPAPAVNMDAFGEGKGTKLFTTCFCKSEDYWPAYYAMYEDVNKAFRENGIVLPAPEVLDVKIAQ